MRSIFYKLSLIVSRAAFKAYIATVAKLDILIIKSLHTDQCSVNSFPRIVFLLNLLKGIVAINNMLNTQEFTPSLEPQLLAEILKPTSADMSNQSNDEIKHNLINFRRDLRGALEPKV